LSEIPVNKMVLAFGQFKCATSCPDQTMPDLRIMAHASNEIHISGLMGYHIFVAIAVVIVNESGHVDCKRGSGDWIVSS
jgi:hypothetical protein